MEEDAQSYVSISAVSKQTGFSVPTLRFYEQEGIIPPVPRNAAGNRCYGKREITRCYTIRCLRNAGLDLPEMKRYFEFVEEGDATIMQRVELLQEASRRLQSHVEELDRSIRFLRKKISYYNSVVQAQAAGLPTPRFHYDAVNQEFGCSSS